MLHVLCSKALKVIEDGVPSVFVTKQTLGKTKLPADQLPEARARPRNSTAAARPQMEDVLKSRILQQERLRSLEQLRPTGKIFV